LERKAKSRVKKIRRRRLRLHPNRILTFLLFEERPAFFHIIYFGSPISDIYAFYHPGAFIASASNFYNSSILSLCVFMIIIAF